MEETQTERKCLKCFTNSQRTIIVITCIIISLLLLGNAFQSSMIIIIYVIGAGLIFAVMFCVWKGLHYRRREPMTSDVWDTALNFTNNSRTNNTNSGRCSRLHGSVHYTINQDINFQIASLNNNNTTGTNGEIVLQPSELLVPLDSDVPSYDSLFGEKEVKNSSQLNQTQEQPPPSYFDVVGNA